MKKLFIYSGILVGALTLGLMSVNGGHAGAEPKALFEQKCSLCHKTDRPLALNKSAKDWKETVTRMQKNSGGRIAPEDIDVITKYLSEIRLAK